MVGETGEQLFSREGANLEIKAGNSRERIPIGDIQVRVERIGETLGMPEEAIERGKRAEAYIVSPEDLAREVEEYLDKIGVLPPPITKDSRLEAVAEALGTSTNQIREQKDRQRAQLREEASRYGGVSIPQDGKYSLVLVSSECKMPTSEVEIHELLHAMADREPGGKTGFQESDGKNHVLNEATVEVLRLACAYPDDPPDVLWRKIRKGEARSPHTKGVNALLGAMAATHLGERPATYQELSEAYFEGDGLGFKMDLVSRSHPKRRQTSERLVKDNFGI